MYVPIGSVVADVTFGSGVFWKKVPKSDYSLRASDIQSGTDCRKLPYEESSLDAIILDPPYMEGFYRRKVEHLAGNGTYAAFRKHYSNGEATLEGPKWHGAVLDLYYKAGKEAHRTLKANGIFIVKCQDEVSANKQNLTHVEIINNYANLGFKPEDIFVVVRTNKPAASTINLQKHARKNHSYFLVFRKPKVERKPTASR